MLKLIRKLKQHSRLSNTGRPKQRNKACWRLLNQVPNIGKLALPPNDRRRLYRRARTSILGALWLWRGGRILIKTQIRANHVQKRLVIIVISIKVGGQPLRNLQRRLTLTCLDLADCRDGAAN
jgi:hypothetical protein